MKFTQSAVVTAVGIVCAMGSAHAATAPHVPSGSHASGTALSSAGEPSGGRNAGRAAGGYHIVGAPGVRGITSRLSRSRAGL